MAENTIMWKSKCTVQNAQDVEKKTITVKAFLSEEVRCKMWWPCCLMVSNKGPEITLDLSHVSITN